MALTPHSAPLRAGVFAVRAKEQNHCGFLSEQDPFAFLRLLFENIRQQRCSRGCMSARGPHIQEQTPSQTAYRVLASELNLDLNSSRHHPRTLFCVS